MQRVVLSTKRRRAPNTHKLSTARQKRPRPFFRKDLNGPSVPFSFHSSAGTSFNVDTLAAPSNIDIDAFKQNIFHPIGLYHQNRHGAIAISHESCKGWKALFWSHSGYRTAQNVIVASGEQNICHASAEKECSSFETRQICNCRKTVRQTHMTDKLYALAWDQLG